MALFGPPNVEKLKSKRDFRGLAKALAGKDEAARRDASAAIADLRDPAAVGEILRVLDGATDEPAIAGIADALRGLGDVAVPPLRESLLTGPPENRALAGGALARMGEPYGFEPLLEAFHDDDLAMRTVGAISLGTLGGERALEAVLESLRSPDDAVRVTAAAPIVVGKMKDPRATEPLMEMLTADNPGVRSMAANALAELRDERSRGVLLATAAKDSDASVRQAAKAALDQLGT